jgi:hypothetical protein
MFKTHRCDGRSSGAEAIGIQISIRFGEVPVNSLAVTPTMVNGISSKRTWRPAMDGSAPNARDQYPKLRTAIGDGLFSTSSAEEKPRPSASRQDPRPRSHRQTMEDRAPAGGARQVTRRSSHESRRWIMRRQRQP